MSPSVVDKLNAEFWNELCGTGLARSLGITEPSLKDLRRFDDAYLSFYPYLVNYISPEDLRGKQVLEIGLGYGTLGQLLASQACRYHGLDIAVNPVAMMRFRLSLLGQGDKNVQIGSALDIPYKNQSFQYVYSIGCLHHTGDLQRGVNEIHRVLVPGGTAVVMLYNRHSFRHLVDLPLRRVRHVLSTGWSSRFCSHWKEFVRSLYDSNFHGRPAPHTDFVSRREVSRLFRNFSSIRTEAQNFDSYSLLRGRIIIDRTRVLNGIAKVLGLDLYIVAVK